MDMLIENLAQKPLVYVTKDIERALGIPLETPGYFIVTNENPYTQHLQEKYPTHVFLIPAPPPSSHDTASLLEHPKTLTLIESLHVPYIVVFKNTVRIERIAQKHNLALINPPSSLNTTIEEKISQLDLLSDYADIFPKSATVCMRDITYDGEPFIIQYNHAHSGEGTMYIDTEETLKALQNTFPSRPVRKSAFIDGPTLTVNCVVTPHDLLIGNCSYQITGLSPLTDNTFSTVGVDWTLAHTLLTDSQRRDLAYMIDIVGNKLRGVGWLGLFGIDVIYDRHSKTMYLVEINPRQPASSALESRLQHARDPHGETIFSAHIHALLNSGIQHDQCVHIHEGAQLIQRVTALTHTIPLESRRALNMLEETENLSAIFYENKIPNRDLVRISSPRGIMKAHRTLNELGERIVDILHHHAESNIT